MLHMTATAVRTLDLGRGQWAWFYVYCQKRGLSPCRSIFPSYILTILSIEPLLFAQGGDVQTIAPLVKNGWISVLGKGLPHIATHTHTLRLVLARAESVNEVPL